MYRERKRQQRDTPQQSAMAEADVPTSQRHLPRNLRRWGAAKWEQLVSGAVDRIVEAIEKRGLPSVATSIAPVRVDMREQITSQAPKLAVGYRLVLHAGGMGDAPQFSPKRSRARDVAWYSLSPFEYPDDIRLRDGCWYRIVCVDAQGRRIRLQPGEPVPGLCYCVGPAQLRGPVDAREPQPRATRTVPSISDSSERSLSAVEKAPTSPAAEAVPVSVPSPMSAPSTTLQPSSDKEMELLINELARSVKLDQGLATPALVIMAPPLPSTAPPASWTRLLATFPPLNAEESMMLVSFVINPELMVQIRYEQQLADAKADGLPPPREPTAMLEHAARQHLHELFTGRLLRPHFWPFCRAVFDYVREHGAEVLAHLPVPIPPLPEAERRWMEAAVTSVPKRTYMHYVCARQDALLSGQPVPVEPSVPLSSKERNQIRKALQDLRAVLLFKQRTPSSEG